MKTLLQLEGVRAGYGPIEVLKGINLAVDEGEIVAVLGANGAGKSTMLMTISGLNQCRSGRIVFGGELAPKMHERLAEGRAGR